MSNFGKKCERCQVYFVAPSFETVTCPWCQRIEEGRVSPELYVSVDGSETVGL